MNEHALMKVDKQAFYDFVRTEPEGRYEFEGGYIVQQMPGGTLTHHAIAGRIGQLIRSQLDGDTWLVVQEFGVETSTTIRYPDVVVVRASSQPESLASSDPAAIVEVLSPSSTARDLLHKPSEYADLPSVQAYLVVAQAERRMVAWVRSGNGAMPDAPADMVDTGAIDVPALGLTLKLDDIYRGIDLVKPHRDPDA